MRTMPRLHIDKQDAQIGIRTTNARLHVNSRRPQMHTEYEAPAVKAERRQPAYKVDWQRVRTESGIPAADAKGRQIAVGERQQALTYVGQLASESDYRAKAEKTATRIPAAKTDRSYDSAKEINLNVTQDENLPTVQWEPGIINISWNNTQMQLEWDSEFMPTFSVEPHSVEIFLRNKPYIRITVTEDAVSGIVDQQI